MFFLILLILVISLVVIKLNQKSIKDMMRNRKNINYLLKRNTKYFLRKKYKIFGESGKREDAKVYNINSDDDVIRYDNGDIYKGQIKNGKREGLGTCYYANKDKYEGMWKNDYMECVGKYIYRDGSFYSGDFKNGCKEGIGVYNCDDYKYIGQYYADRKGRIGTFHLPNKSYLKVIIENGTIVEGTYMREDFNDEYIYNIDLVNEKEIMNNIESYITKSYAMK